MEFRRATSCGSCWKRSWEYTPRSSTQYSTQNTNRQTYSYPRQTYSSTYNSQPTVPATSYSNGTTAYGMPPTTTYY